MEIYDKIWRLLNSVNLKDIEKQNDYKVTINEKEVEQYFARTTKYKILYLRSFNEKDKSFLGSLGISSEFLQYNKYLQLNQTRLMTTTEVALDKSDDMSNLKQATCKQREFLWRKVLNTDYHLSVVDEGYIHAICPHTGKYIRSNISFVFFNTTICYRFVGKEVFYLITGGCDNEKAFLYFPQTELIISLFKSPSLLEKHQMNAKKLNRWKANLVTSWQKIKLYLLHSSSIKTLGLVGLNSTSTAHHIYNDLSGIQNLYKSGLLDKIDCFLVNAQEFYGGIDEIFPEIPANKIKRIKFKKQINLYPYQEEIIQNKYFCFRLNSFWVTESLANRIYQTSLEKCSSIFLDTLGLTKKQYFPLLWINFRLGKRTWLSQVEGIANIIKSIYEKFPRLGVVFDGSSRIDVKGKLLIDEGLEVAIKKEKETLHQIQNLLPPQIKVYDIIGKPMYEVIVWAKAIDLYLAPFGGGLVKVISIANKPGVIHSNKLETYNFSRQGQNLYSLRRQNSVIPVYVPHNYITDAPDDKFSKHNQINRSYECDWKGAYEELFKIAENLQKEK